MIQVRKNVYETNSSSTHSIAISKTPLDLKKLRGRHIRFDGGEWGWNVGTEYCTQNYLYTAIFETSDMEEYEEKIEKIKAILDKYGVTYEFAPVKEEHTPYGSYLTLEEEGDYGIDHSAECSDLIDALLNDEDLLLRYLFGNSCIYTGNDNGCEETNLCFSADESVWDDDSKCFVPNPNHDSEHFHYFCKGN